jgi:hypothetical protein
MREPLSVLGAVLSILLSVGSANAYQVSFFEAGNAYFFPQPAPLTFSIPSVPGTAGTYVAVSRGLEEAIYIGATRHQCLQSQ